MTSQNKAMIFTEKIKLFNKKDKKLEEEIRDLCNIEWNIQK